MVAAQWGEIRDSDARTGGGVSGRFRLLGASGEVPDTTPPSFGTAPWGYRRSEVDAWASWVAGLVAHGRNETVRADSAEATLRATLERLEQLERTPAEPRPEAGAVRPLPTRPGRDTVGGSAPDGDTPPATSGERTGGPAPAPTGPATVGRLHFTPPAGLPRRTVPGGATRPAPGSAAAGAEGTTADGTRPESTRAQAAPGTPSDGTRPESDRARARAEAPPDAPPRDHDLARLHIVETTLHEVLGLLHQLADRDRRPAGS